MSRRMDRINGLLQQEISRILKFDLRDPRISEIISVTRVDVTSDLSQAKVFISILGNEMEKRDSKKGLATLCIGGGMGIAMCIESIL